MLSWCFLFSERGDKIESRAKRELSLSILSPTVDLSIVNILFTWDNFYFIIDARKENIMTRKDYEKFVNVIKDYTIYQRSLDKYFNHYPLVNLFIGVFSADNHRFNSDRFRSAVDTAISEISHEGILVEATVIEEDNTDGRLICTNGSVHDNDEDMEYQFRSPDLFKM